MDVSDAADVRSLIDKFERMCQGTTGAPSVARPRSVSVSARRAPLPPTHPSKDAKAIQELIRRMDEQRAARGSQTLARIRAVSESECDLRHQESGKHDTNAANVAEPEPAPCTEVAVAKPAISSAATPVTNTESLTIEPKSLEFNTHQPDADDDAKTVGSDDESEASICDSVLPAKPSHAVAIPGSPSAYSTASSGSMDSSSLDSLLLSLDCLLPDLLQASGEPSAEAIREAEDHSRRPTAPTTKPQPLKPTSIKPKSTVVSKVRRDAVKEPTPRTLSTRSRRASLSARSPTPTAVKDATPRTTPSRRSSLSARPTAQSSTTTRHFSHSARPATGRRIEPVSPLMKATTCCRSDSTPQALSSRPVPRYMDYAHTERYAATKAMNLERRRLAEERLAAHKAPHFSKTNRTRSPSWQGQLDQVRSQLFEDVSACRTRQPRSAPAKMRVSSPSCSESSATRPRSSSRTRV